MASPNRKMADTLVPLMSDAALYSYTPGQPQSGKNGGALEIVIDYKPNPKFNPPNTEAEALTGLQGRIWIDAKTHYLVRMEGTIARGVNFGWGMLAHIYPGGKLALDQTDAGGNRWIFTNFSMQLSVRALMVKTAQRPHKLKRQRLPSDWADELPGRYSPHAEYAAADAIERDLQAVTRAFAWSVCRRTVRASMRSRCTSKPLPGVVGTTISPLIAHCNLRLDDVLSPVAAGCGDVAGKREVGKRRQGDIVRATDAGLQHSAAPDRDATLFR